MKLRNKRSGEIGYFCFANWNDPVLIIMDNNGVQLGKYTSLTRLNAEWEDYEEPKTFFTIYYDGTISEFKDGDDDQIRDMKAIDNYFSSREEAEQAVEKLKAWKRLKDYNVKFNLDFVRNKIDFTYSVNNPLLSVLDGEEQIFNNMKIIFGGKNE